MKYLLILLLLTGCSSPTKVPDPGNNPTDTNPYKLSYKFYLCQYFNDKGVYDEIYVVAYSLKDAVQQGKIEFKKLSCDGLIPKNLAIRCRN